MRNGNYVFLRVASPMTYGSYRTYEEWKLTSVVPVVEICLTFLPYLWGMETYCGGEWRKHGKKFLPYLWGMETPSWWSSWQQKQSRFLPYLWGMETLHSTICKVNQSFVLTVPMRNGNYVFLRVASPMTYGSYRTYEEWKLSSSFNTSLSALKSSYRTYEEWKHLNNINTTRS